MKILYLDCFSGISGDMLLGSLIDLGAPADAIEAVFHALSIPPVRLTVRKIAQQGISATRVEFDFEEAREESRTYRDIRTLVANASLPARVREDALRVFGLIAEAEAKIHGVAVDEVHFHEVGGIDTICDVVGAVTAMAFLGIEAVHVSPLPCGRGTIRCRHGILPNPAPATLELLKGFELYSLPHKMEFVTPTGAGILRALADPKAPLPPYRLLAVGYGAGTHALEGRPNIVRAVLGVAEEETSGDEVVLLETDIDDETAEVLAHVTQVLFKQGALDVTSHPVLMKKGRLGTRISVVAPMGAQDTLADFLLQETSTLGVRYLHVRRRALERHIMTVSTSLGEAVVKVADLDGEHRRISPEYEACARLAEIHHLPLREVMETIRCETEDLLK